jgi:hypothetical protein
MPRAPASAAAATHRERLLQHVHLVRRLRRVAVARLRREEPRERAASGSVRERGAIRAASAARARHARRALVIDRAAGLAL